MTVNNQQGLIYYKGQPTLPLLQAGRRISQSFVINFCRVTLAGRYDAKNTRNPNELKTLLDDASNRILEMYLAKLIQH